MKREEEKAWGYFELWYWLTKRREGRRGDRMLGAPLKMRPKERQCSFLVEYVSPPGGGGMCCC